MSLHSSLKDTILADYSDDPATQGFVLSEILKYQVYNLPISGGTMTGPLILSRSPESNNEAVRKEYLDSMINQLANIISTTIINNYMQKAGSTMTGYLTLVGNPTSGLHAATKQYVDTFIPLSGGTMTGNLTLSGAPTSSLHAATKAYVDSSVTGSYVPLSGGTMSGNLSISTLTANSLVFAGTSGLLSTNNSQLYWDNINTKLCIGSTTPGGILTITKSSFTASPGLGVGRLTHFGGNMTDNVTAANGTSAGVIFNYYSPNTLASSNTNVTCPNAYNMYINGAPVASTNTTITNSYALFVNGGKVGFANSDFSINTNKFTVVGGSGNTSILGSLGIGLTPGSYQLDLSTDNARKLTTTTWITGSDTRVKLNQVNANLDTCYNNIKNIPLKYFEWNSTIYPDINDRHSLGWIAQDVENILPKAVTQTEDHGFTDFRNLDSDQIIKMMFGAIQKLQLKVEALESQLNQ